MRMRMRSRPALIGIAVALAPTATVSCRRHVSAPAIGFSAPPCPPRHKPAATSALSMAAANRRAKTAPLPTISTPAASTVVIVDVENVRGAAGFRISHEALLYRIRAWREDRASKHSSSSNNCDSPYESSSPSHSVLEAMAFACDHGTAPSMHAGGSFLPANSAAVFAGPGGRTADDVIVELVEMRSNVGGGAFAFNEGRGDEEGDADDGDVSVDEEVRDASSRHNRNTTVVVTGDVKLIARCQKAGRAGNSPSDVAFVQPASLLRQLESFKNPAEEEYLFGGDAVASTASFSPRLNRRGALLERPGPPGKSESRTSFAESRIAVDQHAKFQARFGGGGPGNGPRQANDSAAKDDGGDGEATDGEKNENADHVAEMASKSEKERARLEAAIRTEKIRRGLLLSDAYYLARAKPGGRSGNKLHPKFQNRNISRTQQKKLYTRRYKAKKDTDMADAARDRRESAGRLQANLDALAERSVRGDLCGPLEQALEFFAMDGNAEAWKAGAGDYDPEREFGFGGAIGSDGALDPFSSVLRVPQRKERGGSEEERPPLRIVVISDTHGFEGGLSSFALPSDAPRRDSEGGSEEIPDEGSGVSTPLPPLHAADFLLPDADVLLHCGDFAASGSRKSQRVAARRLDDFLARQSHIPEKIVVKGNHDPDSPARALFPNSGALYARVSSMLVVGGVRFAIEPYSRRSANRRGGGPSLTTPPLPECDVLVTHEPPRGVLDLTYHGMSAGSWDLRDCVERAPQKPRVWMCGHIHEGRGATRKRFRSENRREVKKGRDGDGEGEDEDEDSTTLVINAANANTGKANRLVSGAVIVDVERPHRTASGGGEETAAGTYRVRKFDGGLVAGAVGPPSAAEVAAASLEDLEMYDTRPGVRRRKGIPLSLRQRTR